MEYILKPSNTATNNKSSTISNKTKNNSKLSPASPALSPTSYYCFPKRRGVYVERQMSYTEDDFTKQASRIQNTPVKTKSKKAASYKEFTASNISGSNSLKPDKLVDRKNYYKPIIRKRPNKYIQTGVVNKEESEPKKSKYKSEAICNIDKECVVLQPRKEIIQTPSSYSVYSYDTVDIPNQPWKHKSKTIQDFVSATEPVTLVDQNYNNNDKLYHFFMDLLENTLSDAERLNTQSNDVLEIEQDDAKKLKVEKQYKALPKSKFLGLEDDDLDAENCLPHVYRRKTENDLFPPKLNSKASVVLKKKKQIPTTTSWDVPKKIITPKSRRLQLIKSLKKQLRMDICTYKEPKTIYESLKLLASNKRRRQKTLRFDDNESDGIDGCVLKRRGILGKRKSKKNLDYADPSDHSLKVYDASYYNIFASDKRTEQKFHIRNLQFSSDSSFDAQ